MLVFYCTLLFSGLAHAGPVIYGVSPATISEGYGTPGLQAVTQRLPEIRKLGANVLWLLPVTTPAEEDGLGYDVVDFKKVWPKLGTEQDLRALVQRAHGLGMKVVLDIVLNHSSFRHPFVLDIAEKGKASPYYDLYQHGPKSGVPYARHFHSCKIGGQPFVFYFWEHLLNFNYDSPTLRAFVLDVLKHWMVRFGIDGFRFDASWGPSSRWPQFYPAISAALKRIRPNVILIAEDVAGYPAEYQGTGHPHLGGSGFQVAYDWDPAERDWLSKWSFQIDGEDDSKTVFNESNPVRAADLFIRAVKSGQAMVGIRALRYIQNNDTPGFRRHHTLAQTAFAARVQFLLPGIPLIFYGQEAGSQHGKFELPAFDPKRAMSSHHPQLWKLYQEMIAARQASAALSDGELVDLERISSTRVRLKRVAPSERVSVELDFARLQVSVEKN